MKKMLSLLALTALFLLLALPAMAAQEGYYTYEYSEEWGGAEITGYTGNETNIVVPSKLGGYDVVSIDPNAYPRVFENVSSNATITLPQTLRYLPDIPSQLKALYLPENLEKVEYNHIGVIGNYPTYVDKDSATAKLLLTEPGEYPSMRFFDPDEPNYQIYYVRGENGEPELSLYKYHGAEEVVRIPNGFVYIYDQAFTIDYSIPNTTTKKVYLPDSVISVGQNAFTNLSVIEEIHLSPNITSFGDLIVQVTNNPKLICDKDSVSAGYIDDRVYLNGFTDPDEPDWGFCGDGNGGLVVKKYYGNDMHVTVSDKVTAIGPGAFYFCDALVTLTIPDSVTSLGNLSIFMNDNLTDIYLSNNISQWGPDQSSIAGPAFPTIHCRIDSTTIQTMPKDGTKVNDIAGIKDPSDPDWLWNYASDGTLNPSRYIGKEKHVSVPAGTTEICDRMFAQNPYIETVTLPDGLKKIGTEAFYDAPNLSSVNIPDSVTSIGRLAFCREYHNFAANPSKYPKLTIHLPDNLTSIEDEITDVYTRTYVTCTHGSVTSELFHSLNNSNGVFRQLYMDPRWPDYLIGYYNNEVYFCGYLGTSNILTTPPICNVVAKNAWANTPNNLNLAVVNISEGVTRIEEEGCRFAASTLNLPNSLRTIGKRAFSGATSLIIPEGVTYLPEETFEGALRNLVIPRSVTKIHKNAFAKNWYDDGHVWHAVENIYCYEGSYADGWAKNRPYQEVEYLSEGEYTLCLPGDFFAEMGEDFDWKSCVTIFPKPTVDYTLKITSYDEDVVEVKNGKLILKQPEIAKLKISSPELNASVTEFFTVFAALEDFSLPEYMFRKVGTSEITIKVSDVKPSKGTYPLYNWSRTPITEGFPGHGVTRDRYVTERFEDPSVHYLTATARNGLTRGGYLIFYDIIHDVKFSAFKDTYLVGDIVQPQISVSFDGTVYKNNRYTYTLTSSDPTVAKVTSKGKLQLLSKGTATITCEALDGTTVKRKITVQDINVYTIPKALQVISSEAFAGCPAQKIVIQDGCQAIGNKAFADCPMLETVEIPASVTGIAPDAFDGCPDGFAIVAPTGSYAAQYAEENGYTK